VRFVTFRGSSLSCCFADMAFSLPEFWGKNTHYIDSFALRSLRSIVSRMSSCFLVRVTTREI